MKRHKREKYTFCYLVGNFTPEQQAGLKQQLHEACIDKISYQPGYERLLKLPEPVRPALVLCTPLLAGGIQAAHMLKALKEQFDPAPKVVMVAFTAPEAEKLTPQAHRQGFDALMHWPAADAADMLKKLMSGIAMPAYRYVPQTLPARRAPLH